MKFAEVQEGQPFLLEKEVRGALAGERHFLTWRVSWLQNGENAEYGQAFYGNINPHAPDRRVLAPVALENKVLIFKNAEVLSRHGVLVLAAHEVERVIADGSDGVLTLLEMSEKQISCRGLPLDLNSRDNRFLLINPAAPWVSSSPPIGA